MENETVWLNRHQMAQLFGRDVKTIGKHIANALKEELSDLVATELLRGGGSSVVVAKCATTRKGNVLPTVAKFATVQNEGGRQIVRQVEYYSLDVILSVGYQADHPIQRKIPRQVSYSRRQGFVSGRRIAKGSWHEVLRVHEA